MTDEQRLQELVANFLKNKVERDRLDKLVKSDNAEIKILMRKLNRYEIVSGDKTVKYNSEYHKSLDEEKLLRELHRFAPETGAIQMKEYVDMDILEGEIYREELSEEAMKALSTCYESKEVVKLTVSKTKEEKE